MRTTQKNALTIDLRSNNEEELGKEWLQTRLFAGTGYGHTTLGTVAGLESITLDDVKSFIRRQYTTGNLKIGIHGNVPDAVVGALRTRLGALPAAATPRVRRVKPGPLGRGRALVRCGPPWYVGSRGPPVA